MLKQAWETPDGLKNLSNPSDRDPSENSKPGYTPEDSRNTSRVEVSMVRAGSGNSIVCSVGIRNGVSFVECTPSRRGRGVKVRKNLRKNRS
ncbi:MAG: hypothetical protein FWD52_06965 [Candidatus Bathyarchaeota archaeon]|nr:hypothetical protein [Candidatus Termiticorpusculum sp.]